MTAQVILSSTPPPTAARRGRKTGETYEMFQNIPLNQWATVTFADGAAATAAASTFRTIARREGVQLSVLTDKDDECILYAHKTTPDDE